MRSQPIDVDKNIKNQSMKTKKEKTKLILAAGIGNFLEIFDFTVFSFFSPIIAQVFFKSKDPLVSILLAVSIFGVGFVMRPLGSILIGGYADRHGRKQAMLVTIALMALGGAFIGFAPSYESNGVFSIFFIVTGRLLQGFSAGGEVGAATTLLMESAGKNTRGFFVSWQFIGQGLSGLCGSLMAAGLMHYLSEDAMLSWGWRVPFIFSLIIIPVGLYIRAHIDEPFDKAEEVAKHEKKHPFFILITQHLKRTILGIFFIFPVTVMAYSLYLYMPTYLLQVTNITKTHAFLISSFGSCMVIVTAFFAGILLDKLERRKHAALCILAITFFSSFFTYYYVHNLPIFLIFYTIAISTLGLLMTFSILMIMESFEQKIRATATSVIYALSVTIFGGTAQIIITLLLKLSDKNVMAPFWYLGLALCVGFLAVVCFDEKRYKI